VRREDMNRNHRHWHSFTARAARIGPDLVGRSPMARALAFAHALPQPASSLTFVFHSNLAPPCAALHWRRAQLFGTRGPHSSPAGWSKTLAAMPSLNLLIVGEEKALPDFEEALETCKRYVGPIKLFTAHKAVDAVGRLQASLSL
jgi:hypothetical protein